MAALNLIKELGVDNKQIKVVMYLTLSSLFLLAVKKSTIYN